MLNKDMSLSYLSQHHQIPSQPEHLCEDHQYGIMELGVMPIISNLIISRYTLTFYNSRSICGLLLYIFVNKVTIK